MRQSVCLVLLAFLLSIEALAQTPDALFQTRCAQCHSTSSTAGGALPETLRQMSWQTILTALETGKMKGIGDQLTALQREAIAKSIGTAISQPMPPLSKCTAPPRQRVTSEWSGWSDAANTRFQTASRAGLSAQTAPKLKLKWAFGFPGMTTAFGVPTLSGGKLFVGAADGSVYSLDADSGC